MLQKLLTLADWRALEKTISGCLFETFYLHFSRFVNRLMKRVILVAFISTCTALAQTPFSSPEDFIVHNYTYDHRYIVPNTKEHATQKRLWITSLLALGAATSADALTSFGKTESNSVLASGSGTFGARGVALKSVMAGTVLGLQLVLRRNDSMRTAFICGNFAEAAIFSAAALHNVGIDRKR